MSEQSQGAGPSLRGVEVGVALTTAAFAVVVITGSLQAGIDWGLEGPKAGFFPFYLGLIILGCSIVNLVQVASAPSTGQRFAEWRQLGKVLSVALPTAVYVVAISYIGIYVASTILIALFMVWLGRYGWVYVVPVSVGVPLATFLVFEKWFIVSLPKGPVENALGF
jgi:putative tricarboxylic transport membrane protein